jgi:KDO2-lipid IV(A) lauroyltransferase
MTTPAPAALALKLKVPMIFASNKRLGGARFAVTVYPPLEFTPSGDDDADMRAMTEAINLRLEEMVRADPGQWLWIHRRWPSARDVTTSKRL